ncbi:hypothetical protein BJF93_00460 [Xaviernesmea oryzae]|uniref:UDP-N-acetylglucosamine kinase n=1 Tax=Xaviernesmea oryzae TaxID=464029 RepID=A0A1Q9B0E5_9HYPH|nr:zeta toxin family protein [Xaviernesmea oryzae]OLP61445.1 hypothetical protein BJF93_00460 [Xaviernesmea oryzae]SEL69059.1 Zeta toxin [Xaviernesmea oryzae]
MLPNDRPELVVLAGPNGAGKSSLYKIARFSGVFINADEIARRLDPENPQQKSMAAGRQAIRRLDEAFLAGVDIVYETTLSSH